MISELKVAGIFSKLDRFWIFATEQQQHARVSLVNSSSTQISEVLSPVWVRNQGYDGDGSGYLNTKYIPNTQREKMSLNDASYGVYITTLSDAVGAGRWTFGAWANFSGGGTVDTNIFIIIKEWDCYK